MNKQQEMQRYFDRAVGGVIKQGRKSVNMTSNSCRYRGSNGTKCAIGQLLPDDFPFGDIEGTRYIKNSIFPVRWERYYGFFRSLQYIHDDAPNTEQFLSIFKTNAKSLALKYNLEWRF